LTPKPPAFWAVTVKVIESVPALVRVVPLGFSVTVDPTISMGTCDDTDPDVAVIVAVRLIGPFGGPPDENVAVAVPVSSVVTLYGATLPVSALMVITTPDNAALEEFFAVTVIVEDVEPSDLTVGGEAKRSIEAAVGVVSVVPGTASSLLPPHPLRQQNRAKQISSSAGRENLAVIDFTIIYSPFPEGKMTFLLIQKFYQKYDQF
jgi:hypothetical protein